MDNSKGRSLTPLFANNDPSIVEEAQTLNTSGGQLDVYVARPSNIKGKLPGLLLIHDRLGLLPHFADVARRLARIGYIVAAPDLLTIAGGALSFAHRDENIEALHAISTETKVVQLQGAVDGLAAIPECDEKRLGCVGFCFGGTMAWLVAAYEQRLTATVVFYGGVPSVELVPQISAPVLAIYGSLDEKVNAGIPIIEPAMLNAGKSFEKEIYDGAHHGFFHDGHGDHFNPVVADQAWSRATTFLDKYMQ